MLICAALVVAAASQAVGQTFHGGLRGSVRDVNGIIPHADVTITNEATNLRRSTTSNDVGEYAFSAVDPGTYTLRVALSGFRTFEQQGLIIATQTFLTVDVMLEVGDIHTSLTVVGAASPIERSNASKGAVIDKKTLETLPTPYRNAFVLSALVPTIVFNADPRFTRQQDQTASTRISLGGAPNRSNNYLIDGVSIIDLRNRAVVNPTIEALEDVKIQMHTYDAEVGRAGGGAFNATAKSGSNALHGSALYQMRPAWAQANDYFNARAGVAKPPVYYHLWGGGVGGPIVRNRTFFWFASESYRSNTAKGAALIFPTDRERAGDFSNTFNENGQLIVIYDPLTTGVDPTTGRLVRDPFPGNVIPPDRINGVAARIASYIPRPDADVSNQLNTNRTAQIIDRGEMYTAKVEHKFSDRVSVAGFYLYNRTGERGDNYWEPGSKGKNRFADPNEFLLERRPQILSLNHAWIPSDDSVVTFRYGWTRFRDDVVMTADFDPATLGFNPAFINAMQARKFPFGRIEGYEEAQFGTFGASGPSLVKLYSSGFNGSYSRFVGRHTFKTGAEYRKVGVDAFIIGQSSGSFRFDRFFTSADPTLNGTPTFGNAFASFLLGYPSGNQSSIAISTPFNAYTRYYAAYAHDDWRVTPSLTVNYGLRLEHEDGLREVENRFTVAFDPTLVSPINGQVTLPDLPGQPSRPILGGLVYAGQNGAPTHQGDPPAIKWSPRAGLAWSVGARTVVRGGYGIYWAPWAYPGPSTGNYGQIGYTQTTFVPQPQFVPTVTLDDPFPNGIQRPAGSALGALAGVGGAIEYIDQHKRAPRIQQYSADIQRELPGGFVLTLSYLATRGDHLSLGGANDSPVNMNQLDPKYMALGSRLFEFVPNPFFAAGLTSLPNAAPCRAGDPRGSCVELRQLLRPFPQFGDVNARQISAGRSRYHAGVIELQKAISRGWGGRVSYTYSRLRDNQFGETTIYSRVSGLAMNSYDLDAEYGLSIIDIPHRAVLAPIVELPFGSGRAWLNGSGWLDAVLGGWTAAALMTLESGFPINVTQQMDSSRTFSGAQRPNLNPGVDPRTPGKLAARLTTVTNPGGRWINPAAFSAAPAFTFGNAPRTLSNLRTPHRTNLDVAIAKDVRFGGGAKGTLRVEILNVNNSVKVVGPPQRLGTGTFGKITQQAGFPRTTQVTFRVTF